MLSSFHRCLAAENGREPQQARPSRTYPIRRGHPYESYCRRESANYASNDAALSIEHCARSPRRQIFSDYLLQIDAGHILYSGDVVFYSKTTY